VTFDPIGDSETRGYLRNVARTKDSKIVRQMEHASFTTGLDTAFAKLASQKQLSYGDVLDTHKTLFGAVYPWAGQDRLTTAPRLVVSKGNDRSKISFAYPQDSGDFQRRNVLDLLTKLALGLIQIVSLLQIEP